MFNSVLLLYIKCYFIRCMMICQFNGMQFNGMQNINFQIFSIVIMKIGTRNNKFCFLHMFNNRVDHHWVVITKLVLTSLHT